MKSIISFHTLLTHIPFPSQPQYPTYLYKTLKFHRVNEACSKTNVIRLKSQKKTINILNPVSKQAHITRD